MTLRHKFRFGVLVENMTTREAWVAKARRIEALGYSTLLMRDHFVPAFGSATFAPIAALAVAAEVTESLLVGTLVIDNDFRHPATLAKEVATLDLLSGGRFELGLGAGWLESEYQQLGVKFDPAGVRIERLEEALRLFKQLFCDDVVSFAGDHYQLDNLKPFPQPHARRRPRILVGAGKKRMCRLAGREADIVSLMTVDTSSGVMVADPAELLAESVRTKIGWVREGAGDRFQEIELSTTMSVTITGDRRGVAAELVEAQGWTDVTIEDVLEMPSRFIGTVAEIVEQMRTRRDEDGFSYYIVTDKAMETCAPIVAAIAGS